MQPLTASNAPRERRAIVEKRVLLLLLAMREAERRGMALTSTDVQQTSDQIRVQFGLSDGEACVAWMKSVGLDEASYTRFMVHATAVRLVQEAMSGEIADFIDVFEKVQTLRHR
jgi:hypothetical protein